MTPSDTGGRGGGIAGRLARLIAAEPHEIPAVLAGFALFFLVFASYFMLRPVRETMGVAGGVENLQWLFTGTFVVTLALVPLYGALSARVRRSRLLPWSYGICAATLLAFAAGLWGDADNVWIGRVFYIWLSVFNLFIISLGWSLMADVFRSGQARRLFAPMAAGASLGGLAGPLFSTLTVPAIGLGGLLLTSAVLLMSTLVCVRILLAWRRAYGPREEERRGVDRPLGGSILAGLTHIARSPYLMGIALFVVLLTSVSTFLYFEQARLVAETFPDRVRHTQVFGAIDTIVQSLTIFIQIFVTGQIARRLGVTVLLVIVPLAMILAFGALALAAVFPVLAVAMVLRRVGEYAFSRPGREMLFTTVGPEDKYKAKNAIDTLVYRGGDALSAWGRTGVDAVSTTPAAAMIAGAGIAAVWALVGFRLGRAHDTRKPGSPS